MLRNLISRRETIIFTTIDLMDKNGVNAVSTKEIAKAEGITEAAIYKHFDKKIDLLKAVLDYFSQYDKEIFESVQHREYDPLEAILKYYEAYATYYQNYSAITVIYQAFEELRLNEQLSQSVSEIFENRIFYIQELIEIALSQHLIEPQISKEILADILMGTFNGICLKWRMKNYQFDLKQNVQEALNTIVNQVKMQ